MRITRVHARVVRPLRLLTHTCSKLRPISGFDAPSTLSSPRRVAACPFLRFSAHRVCFCRLPPPPDSHPTEASPFLQPQKAATLPSSPIISSGTPRWPSHSQADQGALPLISLNSRALGGGVFGPVSRPCHLACSLSFMRTALHLAACEGHFHICELLLQNGADVNAMDEE